MTSAKPTLIHLLQAQISNYRLMLDLERDLNSFVGSADFKSVRSNTETKLKLMVEVRQIEQNLHKMLPPLLNDAGKLPDHAAETLRLDALSLLKELLELEEKNLDKLRASRTNTVKEMKKTKTARKVARGYKPSSSDRPSKYLDTKR